MSSVKMHSGLARSNYNAVMHRPIGQSDTEGKKVKEYIISISGQTNLEIYTVVC